MGKICTFGVGGELQRKDTGWEGLVSLGNGFDVEVVCVCSS